ncbi:MAG TPA: dolichyl-phosphate beta-glucosyltransferase [Thermoanaerobaculia bacterium]|nr:dolichyl-phosphate beta-glucosyltransferase [Thermoanaerobaculia bacterium]
MPELSVVVPAYNEEARLAVTLPAILDYLEATRRSFEVLVVDDGSSDATARVAQSFAGRGVKAIRMPRNRGKGAALRTGVLASRGDRVLLTDADLSTPISELERLERHLGGVEMVFGSRAVEGARIDHPQPVLRQWMGKTFNLMIRLLVAGGIRDTQCGFKLLDGPAARAVFADLRLDGFAYDVELLWLARRRGLRVAEVGVTWSHSPDSRVHLITDSIRMALDVLRIRLLHWSRGARATKR